MFENERNYEEEIQAAEAKLAELKKAQLEKVEAEKKAAALARKEEAAPVIEAINVYEEAKVTCNEQIKKAYEEYRAAVEAAERTLKEVESAADEKLNAFLESHPDGFHYTYRSNDGKVVRRYDYRKQSYNVFDNYNNFVKAINDLWKF